MMIPRDVRVLCMARRRLLEQLAPVLRRAGPNHPNRAVENQQRTAKRKVLRVQLRANADQIAALTMSHTHRRSHT